MNRFLIGCLCFILLGFMLLGGRPDLLSLPNENDPMDQREEKLKAFRTKRDQFFKEDPHSPLKEADRKKFKGLLYYPINLQYAMTGSIERYSTEPKPIYVNLPTNKERERRYVKYGRFKFRWKGKKSFSSTPETSSFENSPKRRPNEEMHFSGLISLSNPITRWDMLRLMWVRKI